MDIERLGYWVSRISSIMVIVIGLVSIYLLVFSEYDIWYMKDYLKEQFNETAGAFLYAFYGISMGLPVFYAYIMHYIVQNTLFIAMLRLKGVYERKISMYQPINILIFASFIWGISAVGYGMISGIADINGGNPIITSISLIGFYAIPCMYLLYLASLYIYHKARKPTILR